MKHSNLYLGLVLPSGGWQSLIEIVPKNTDTESIYFLLRSETKNIPMNQNIDPPTPRGYIQISLIGTLI